jgi:hypothetical protein
VQAYGDRLVSLDKTKAPRCGVFFDMDWYTLLFTDASANTGVLHSSIIRACSLTQGIFHRVSGKQRISMRNTASLGPFIQ